MLMSFCKYYQYQNNLRINNVWSELETKFFRRKTNAFPLLDSVKLTLAESRVYGFCSFFVRSIFLRRCEWFFLSSRRPCFYKASCYPVVLFVSILSSVGSISCLCRRTCQHPLWPDFHLVSLQLHSKSTLRVGWGLLALLTYITPTKKIYFSISYSESSTYSGHHRSNLLWSRFLVDIKFEFDFWYFLDVYHVLRIQNKWHKVKIEKMKMLIFTSLHKTYSTLTWLGWRVFGRSAKSVMPLYISPFCMIQLCSI